MRLVFGWCRPLTSYCLAPCVSANPVLFDAVVRVPHNHSRFPSAFCRTDGATGVLPICVLQVWIGGHYVYSVGGLSVRWLLAPQRCAGVSAAYEIAVARRWIARRSSASRSRVPRFVGLPLGIRCRTDGVPWGNRWPSSFVAWSEFCFSGHGGNSYRCLMCLVYTVSIPLVKGIIGQSSTLRESQQRYRIGA